MEEKEERPLTKEESEKALGLDYYLDDVLQLLSDYKARGESVCTYFNGFKLSLKDVSSVEELKKQYLDYAEKLRTAFLSAGGFHYDEDDREI